MKTGTLRRMLDATLSFVCACLCVYANVCLLRSIYEEGPGRSCKREREKG